MAVDELYDLYVKYTPKIENSDTWIHSGSPLVHVVPAVLTVLYLLLLTWLPGFQKKQKLGLYKGNPVGGKPRFYLKSSVKVVFFVWNMLLSAYSFVTVLFCALHLIRQIRTGTTVMEVLCPSDMAYNKPPVHFWLFCFVLSKYFELFDTAFMLIKNPWRKPLFLHRWHHFSVVYVAWYGQYFDGSVLFVGCLMNTFVHWLMYLYYALVLYFPPPMAILLTTTQTLQMVVGVSSNIILFVTYPTTGNLCAKNRGIFVFVGVIYLTYLILFVQFFYGRYINPAPRNPPAPKKPVEEKRPPTETPKKTD